MKQLSDKRPRVTAVVIGDSYIGKRSSLPRPFMTTSPTGAYKGYTYDQDIVKLTIPGHHPPKIFDNTTYRIETNESLQNQKNLGTTGPGEMHSVVDGSTTIDVEMAIWTLSPEMYEVPKVIAYFCATATVVGLCYKVTDDASFDHAIHKWYPLMKTYLPAVPFVLIGCQSDLLDTSTVSGEDVTRTQEPRHSHTSVLNSASEIDAVAVVETTAAEGLSIRLAFETLAWYGYYHQRHVQITRSRSCVIQ